MSNRLILFPYGGNTREAMMSIRAINAVEETWDVIGFIDDDETKKGMTFEGIPVLGTREELLNYPDSRILAVPGHPDNYLRRKGIIQSLKIDSQRCATIMDPSVRIDKEAKIGKNVLIMAHVVISAQVTIGDHCVILPNTVLSHESQVGDYCCLGSNVSVSGNVIIEDNCYIGSGVSIIQNTRLGAGSLVGMGSSVLHDVAKDSVVAGNPARFLRHAKQKSQGSGS